jgi:hypothetical protein
MDEIQTIQELPGKHLKAELSFEVSVAFCDSGVRSALLLQPCSPALDHCQRSAGFTFRMNEHQKLLAI